MPRTAIQSFSEANNAYIGATVTIYQALPDGTADTLNKATLYMNLTGGVTLPNPQTLDSNGKWLQPVYIEDDVVAAVTTSDFNHETGVIRYGGAWRDDYVLGGTRYVFNDIIVAPVGSAEEGNIYFSQSIWISTTWVADVGDAAKLVLFLDVQALTGLVVPDASETLKGKVELDTISEFRTGTDDVRVPTARKVSTLWREGSAIATTGGALAKPSDANIGKFHHLTGSLGVNAMWASDGHSYQFYIEGTPTFFHSANLILPGGIDIQGQPGEVIELRDEGANVWRVVMAPPRWFPSTNLAGRNLLINGKIELAQRGTTFAAIANNAYSVDRWACGYVTTAVVTASQQADAPSTDEFRSSLRLAVTTADAAIAAGDMFVVRQRIEGYNVRHLIGEGFTLSFWARSSKTGIHCVSFQNSVPDRSYVAEYTINAANTWERKTITVPAGLITAGTWDWTTGIGLVVNFAMAGGTTFQAAAGAWQVGNFIATANQVNCLDTIGNIFAVTGAQLEVGTVSTEFDHRPIQQELALCQRYYEKSFALSQAPVQNLGSFAGALGALQCVGASVAGQGTQSHTFCQRKRIVPTITTYNPAAANAQLRNGSIGADCSLTAVSTATGEGTILLSFSTAAGSAAGHTNFVHWTADAEL